jgi:hypothetical protein
LEVEVLSPEERTQRESEGFEQPRVRLTHVRALGLVGTALALLTMFAAVGVGFLVLFGTTLLASAAAYALWPLIFSAQFTEFVFGSARAPFWKLFVLFLVAGSVVRLFRRFSGGR